MGKAQHFRGLRMHLIGLLLMYAQVSMLVAHVLQSIRIVGLRGQTYGIV